MVSNNPRLRLPHCSTLWRKWEDEDEKQHVEGNEKQHVEVNENQKLELPHVPVYCSDCQMWLNGQTQWQDHRIGKKHRKRRNTARSDVASGSGV